MPKRALRLRLLGLGAICALFAACENTPSNLKQPLVAMSGFSFYDDPLSYINNVRAKSGLNYFAQNEILNISALNHAKYVVANEAMSHDESPGKPNFTGENPSKRAFYAGYNAVVRENLSYNSSDLKSAIDGLLSAIYHRFAFLDFSADEIGIGYFEHGKKSSYVFEMGNSRLNAFCSRNLNDEGSGKFLLGMCKNETLRMREDKFKGATALNSRPYVYYPNDEPALAFFSNEIPDPMPECKITANPVSVEFNSAQPPVAMKSFKIYEGGRELQNIKILDKNSDPNAILSDRQFVLFGREVFKFDAKYGAEFNYEQGGKQKTLRWEFITQAPKFRYFVVQGGENLSVKNGAFYDIFVTPKDCNDLMKSYKTSYSFMDKPEISSPAANMLRVKLNGAKGAKLEISTDNGAVINLYLSDDSKSYGGMGKIYAAIAAVLTAIILFYLLARRRGR